MFPFLFFFLPFLSPFLFSFLFLLSLSPFFFSFFPSFLFSFFPFLPFLYLLWGKDARADNIEQARHSITLVTSLWASGECGPLCVVLPTGFLADEELSILQQKYAPDVYFISSKSSSHFMTAETVVNYFDDVLADAFARRRRLLAHRHGRPFDDEWGAILCDSFSGHHAMAGGSDLQRSLAEMVLLTSATYAFLYKNNF